MSGDSSRPALGGPGRRGPGPGPQRPAWPGDHPGASQPRVSATATLPVTQVTDPGTLQRIRALAIPPGWQDVWISPDPLGHIQATGVDRRDRTQYRYHQVWREQRDAQKFAHMLRFAGALPALRDRYRAGSAAAGTSTVTG